MRITAAQGCEILGSKEAQPSLENWDELAWP